MPPASSSPPASSTSTATSATIPAPSVAAHSDGNEATDPTTPEVWAEHSVWPQDPGFTRALANGGVTALQILPGSANLMGGRSVTLKNVPARTVQGMKFPGAPYGMKMACGENPKRVYGGKGRMPSTRMGNYRGQPRRPGQGAGISPQGAMTARRARDLGMETLAGVLDGKILVHNHCYRADEMAHRARYGQGVRLQGHRLPSRGRKLQDRRSAARRSGICSAIWADWCGFKMESYDGIPENAALLHNAGACVVIHSDDENGIQRLNQEAAKAQAAGRRMGIDIPDDTVIRWLTLNPAQGDGHRRA